LQDKCARYFNASLGTLTIFEASKQHARRAQQTMRARARDGVGVARENLFVAALLEDPTSTFRISIKTAFRYILETS